MRLTKTIIGGVWCCLFLIAGCQSADNAKRGDTADHAGAARTPKTSFGQAIAKAHEAARETEDAQQRELDSADSDDSSSEQ